MIRLDKYLANLWFWTRSTIPYLIKEGGVSIDGVPILRPDHKVAWGTILQVDGQEVEVKTDVSLLLYKPAGYVCSDIPEGEYLSYKELLADCVYLNLVHVWGRLDVDTTWLVFCSSNWGLVHRIIAPKTHVEKEYIVTCKHPIDDADLHLLARGVGLDDWYVTMPAQTERISPHEFRLVLREGKFHQVKRMVEAVKNEVTALHRTRIGPWTENGLTMGKRTYIQDPEKDLKDRQKALV